MVTSQKAKTVECGRSAVESGGRPNLMETSNAAPAMLKSPPKALPILIPRYGYREGSSKREVDPDYCRVLAVDLGTEERLIVCRDEFQVIHQKYNGNRWRSTSFHMTINNQLQKILRQADVYD